MIFVMKFQAAAMSRANIEDKRLRRDFCLYVDEFQNFSTESFASILSEARKYGLNLMVANQFITQLSDEVREAVFGNIGTIISFRVGTADAEALEKIFRPIFDIDDLQRLPMANNIVRTLIGGVPTQPFSMTGLPILGNSNKQLAQALKQLSAAKYGRPKPIVESEIFKRLSTDKPDKPAMFGSAASASSSVGSVAPNHSAMSTGTQSSFLDEWLAKRRAAGKAGPKQTEDLTNSHREQTVTNKVSNINKLSNDKPNEQRAKFDSELSQATKNSSDQVAGLELKIPNDNVLRHNDTIHIDREGNLSQQ
jgi:hypothetical protein